MQHSPEMTGASVTVEGLRKAYAASIVLDDLSLSFSAGAFTAVLGPSGCGKSTMLRVIAGLERPDKGRIVIDGRDVTATKPSARGISMVFQNYALFPHLDVEENILFGLRARGATRAHRTKRLAFAADLLDLGPHLKKRPSMLSGGQQQRVALSRAIVGERSIILMDEPLSNLDAKLRGELRRELRDLQERLGITVIYVTHDQLEALTMADQVVLLNNGRIEQSATPRAIFERPQTLFAASFVGSPKMNLIGADLLAPYAGEALKGITAGLRPETLRLERLRPNGRAPLAVRVTGREYHGADMLLTLDLKDQSLRARVSPQAADSLPHDIGLGFDIADLHLFDAATGVRADHLRRHFDPASVSFPSP